MIGKSRSPLKGKPLRLPGQSVDEARLALVERMFERPALLSIVLVVLAFMEWYRHFFKLPTSPVLYTAVAAISLAFTAWRFYRMLPQVRQLRQATEGEKVVGQYLENFRAQGYHVFHDLIGVGFNVDHVLIGPAGVFTIETKTWSKPIKGDARITFDGESIRAAAMEPDRDPMIQAFAQAGWLRELLKESTGKSYLVRPVIVFPGWFIEKTGESSRPLWVLNPKALPAFLDNEPTRLPNEDIRLASYHLSRFVRGAEEVRR